MAKFKNVSPLGALDIPTLGIVVEAGKTFEVPKNLIDYFAGQTANFARVVPRNAPKDDQPADETPADDIVPDTGDTEKEAGQ